MYAPLYGHPAHGLDVQMSRFARVSRYPPSIRRRILPFGQDRETAAREGPRPFAPLFRVLVSSAIIVTLMLRNMMANLKKFLTFSEDTVKNNRIFSKKG
jgi:hypothetical protein